MRRPAQRIALLLRQRLEVERADVEAVEVHLVGGTHDGGPISRVGRQAATRARSKRYKTSDNRHHALHAVAFTRPRRRSAIASVPTGTLAPFASILCLAHVVSEPVKNTATSPPCQHKGQP